MAPSVFPQFPSGAPRSARSNLGEILLDVGVISSEQLNQALAAAGGMEKDIAKWLVDLGYTTEEKIMKGIGIKAKVPYFTSLEGLYTMESGNLISEELARRLQVVPLFRIDNVVTVAMVNPLDVFIIDSLCKTTGYRIDPVVCMRSTIFETINKLYGGWESAQIPMETSHWVEPPQIESPQAPKAQIMVTNGVETLSIDAADEAEAAKDGYRRVG